MIGKHFSAIGYAPLLDSQCRNLFQSNLSRALVTAVNDAKLDFESTSVWESGLNDNNNNNNENTSDRRSRPKNLLLIG